MFSKQTMDKGQIWLPGGRKAMEVVTERALGERCVGIQIVSGITVTIRFISYHFDSYCKYIAVSVSFVFVLC